MIVCVTPNAAVDRTLTVPGFGRGGTFRPLQGGAAAGGKGINVVRAVHNLGGTATCCGLIAGFSGRFIAHHVEREGFPARWTLLEAGESRTCIILLDPERQLTSVVNERGPDVTVSDWMRLRDDIFALSKSTVVNNRPIVSFSGSLPPGSPPDIFATLLRDLDTDGVEVWVDTSGDALRTAAQVRGVHLKINDEEAGDLLGERIKTPAEAADAGTTLRSRTGGTVVITLGARGAVAVVETAAFYAQPPVILATNAVASGDSFLAGVLFGREQDKPMPEILCQAVAAGAANAASGGRGGFTRLTFEVMLAQTSVENV